MVHVCLKFARSGKVNQKKYATDKQIKLANDLRVRLPCGCSRKQASRLIRKQIKANIAAREKAKRDKKNFVRTSR